MSRIMIAGTSSGAGKTTVSCSILAAFKAMGKDVISFKCGPDYIDPMFHKKVTQIDSRNLDVFLMGEENVLSSLQHHETNRDIAIIEGVMGLYDGVGKSSNYSSNQLSLLTETPVLLVVNVKGKSNSICAEIKGYLEYEKNNICAVLLNNVSEGMYAFYKEMIEAKLGIKVAGFLPNILEASFESRHLGLITVAEIKNIQDKIKLLAENAVKHIELDWIFQKASECAVIECSKQVVRVNDDEEKAKIYVAKDEAFCFFYEENHELLRSLGAEIKFFSPLNDKELPDDADGLILWGGYPELHAKLLEKNESMKSSILTKIENDLPVYAECGGFMYLHKNLICKDGSTFHFVGALDGCIQMTSSLQNFGYVELTAEEDNILCKKGDKINAHSFHYSKSTFEGESFIAQKINGSKSYSCIVAKDKIFAGYPHIHFWSNPLVAENFVKCCKSYRKEILSGFYNEPS